MADFAISDGSTIVNVIVAETQEIAEQATAMSAIPTSPGSLWIGWTLVDGEWVAPVPMPSEPGRWRWDEDAQEWINTTPPAE